MKKVIYKYTLDLKDAPKILTAGPNQPFEMEMIKGAEILTVQTQFELSKQGVRQGVGKIWALCNPTEKRKEERQFMLMETGKEFDVTEKTKYIGTYQLYGGDIILHLFEIIK